MEQKQFKKTFETEKNEIFFLIWIFFNENHTPTRHIKYKGEISFLETNQLWQISFFQPIWNDF